ncbi:MAG: hypothetical protein HN771_06425 [Gammaproteobacteria bacterium]|jgi:hypothetical protein|nr:hypothetical protein [Gammaproteobacteria bacterium]MBT7391081.1 hypothetical protein [Gammaproteobacteria bacterium]
MQDKLAGFLYKNIISFLVIIFVTFINGQAFISGNIIWLPIGAVSLCYLLFGFNVFIAVFLAITFSSLWFHDSSFIGINLIHLVGTFSPLLAIASMKFFKLSNFFEGGKLVFQHLLFLAILTALYNTLMKFFVYSYLSSGKPDDLSINAINFITNYLIGDVLGCLAILFFAALVVVPGIRFFAPKLVPSKFKAK